MTPYITVGLTYWNAKIWCDCFNHTQNVKSTATHIGEEKHDPNATAKLWTQGSTDHVW